MPLNDRWTSKCSPGSVVADCHCSRMSFWDGCQIPCRNSIRWEVIDDAVHGEETGRGQIVGRHIRDRDLLMDLA